MLVPKSARIRIRSGSSVAFDHAETPAQAARPNMNTHAGPKIQLEGFHDGLRRFSYQVPTAVDQPPTASISSTVSVAATIGRVNAALK